MDRFDEDASTRVTGAISVPIEVWRGGVNAWECDEMGHLNTRFYVARSMEGLAMLMALAGMPGFFSPGSPTTIVMTEQHIRFLKEARAAAPLHMTGAFTEIDAASASVVLMLYHSQSGDIAATFRMKLAHAASHDETAPAPWPDTFLEPAQLLVTDLPKEAQPRSAGDDPVPVVATVDLARSLGLARIAMGIVGPEACDAFGRMQAQKFIGAVSDGIRQLTAPLRDIVVKHAETPPQRCGGAVLEFRIIHAAWPRCGDAFEIRSALRGADQRTMSIVHWMLDPVSGKAWGMMQSTAVTFDLDARRVVPISQRALQELSDHAVPEVSFGNEG